MPTVLIIAPLLKDFQQNGTKIPTVAVREVVTDFKKSIRIRSYSYDTVLVSASYCTPQTRAELLLGRNRIKVYYFSDQFKNEHRGTNGF